MALDHKMHLGVIGYGSIATSLMELLSPDTVSQVTVLLKAESPALKRIQAAGNSQTPAIQAVTSFEDLRAAHPDLIVECAGHGAVAAHVPALLRAGHDVIIASVGALADRLLNSEISRARAVKNARIILPSGAIGGLDILRALSQHGDIDLTYQGVKPPSAWKGSPADAYLDHDALTEPVTFFTGTGREAALTFPKNANVVAALALAGGGFDRMTVELIADPKATSNQHSYTVRSPLCSYSMIIQGVATAGNARTSATTVLSLLQEIKDYHRTSAV